MIITTGNNQADSFTQQDIQVLEEIFGTQGEDSNVPINQLIEGAEDA